MIWKDKSFSQRIKSFQDWLNSLQFSRLWMSKLLKICFPRWPNLRSTSSMLFCFESTKQNSKNSIVLSDRSKIRASLSCRYFFLYLGIFSKKLSSCKRWFFFAFNKVWYTYEIVVIFFIDFVMDLICQFWYSAFSNDIEQVFLIWKWFLN